MRTFALGLLCGLALAMWLGRASRPTSQPVRQRIPREYETVRALADKAWTRIEQEIAGWEATADLHDYRMEQMGRIDRWTLNDE